jgi:TonB family protein
LLRPRLSSPQPAPKPADHITLPGNTKPFEPGDPPAPKPAPAPPEPAAAELPRPEPETQITRNTTAPPPVPQPGRDDAPRAPATGVLGRALQNLDRYAQTQAPANPLGGATDPGSAAIQFDRKGVNFDPWLRRFVSQVRRNWFVPLSAMNFKGRVVLQFVIHKDGRITDVHVAQPSDIDSFNRAAYNAIVQSNPTEPFPREYPDEAAPFTVTFFYNEQPPS